MNRFDIVLGRKPPEEPSQPDFQLSGEDLDRIGEICNLIRRHLESDESFRDRIRATFQTSSTHQIEDFLITPAFNDRAVIREHIFALLSGYTSRVSPIDQYAIELGNQINLTLHCLRESRRIHYVPEITVVRSPASSFGWAVCVDGENLNFR